MSGYYPGRKTEASKYMEQRTAVFAYLKERSAKGKLNQWRVTVDEVLANIDVDHGFSVRDQMKQFFIEQAREKTLNGGRFTSVHDKPSTSNETTSETTETELQEESNQTESTPTEDSEETSETTTEDDSNGVGGTTESNDG